MRYLKALGLEDVEENPVYWAYRNQYWIAKEHFFSQVGIYGQFVSVFPKLDLVIAKVSSSETAGDRYGQNISLLFAIGAKFAEMSEIKKPKKSKSSKRAKRNSVFYGSVVTSF